MKRTNVIALLAGALLLSGGAAHASMNLVTNGSFELGSFGLGSFQGWQLTAGDANTFVDSSGQTGTAYGQASDGLWAAYFGSTADVGGATISQSLSTVAGQTYVLSFDLANDNGGVAPSNAFAVSIGGVKVFDAADLPAQNYVHEQVTFTASGTSLLSISGSNDASWIELDNVAVAAVPEPASAWMAVAGLALVGGFVGMRRKG